MVQCLRTAHTKSTQRHVRVPTGAPAAPHPPPRRGRFGDQAPHWPKGQALQPVAPIAEGVTKQPALLFLVVTRDELYLQDASHSGSAPGV